MREIRAVWTVEQISLVFPRAASPIIYIYVHYPVPSPSATLKAQNPREPCAALAAFVRYCRRRARTALMQDIVGKVLTQGVYIRCARGVQELAKARPNIRLTVTAAQSCEECKRGAGVIKLASRNCLQSGNEGAHYPWSSSYHVLRYVILFQSIPHARSRGSYPSQ